MGKTEVLYEGLKAIKSLAKDKNIRKSLFGEYTDGTTRNLSDAIYGEILSPKDRKRYVYKKNKGKKKKKKKVRVRL